MKYNDVPVGFGMALMQNVEATNAFAMMTHEDKLAVWEKARAARSRREMEQIVSDILKKQ